jgi:hypothetical protein
MSRPELPHAQDIRQARAAVEACQDAALLHQHLKTARTALSILSVQHGSGMPIPPTVPGDDVVVQAAARFETLRDLAAAYPAQADPAVRLHARMQQLDLIELHLRPLLDEREQAAALLHDLQHRQHHALEQPAWADAVAELGRLGARRDTLALEMAPLQHQIALVEPVREMLAGFHPQLREELVTAARTDDPNGVVAWRAAVMAHQHLVGLAHVIEQLGLVVQYPFEPMLPDDPHPRHRRRLRQEAGGVLEWMVRLDEALGQHGEALQQRYDLLKAEHDTVEAELREWMG